MGDAQLAGDVARPHPLVGELDDALPHHVREGASVHEDAAQLVHAAVTCGRRKGDGQCACEDSYLITLDVCGYLLCTKNRKCWLVAIKKVLCCFLFTQHVNKFI